MVCKRDVAHRNGAGFVRLWVPRLVEEPTENVVGHRDMSQKVGRALYAPL